MSDPPPYPGTPRWVKVFGIVIIIVVLLVVARVFVGGGEHGPGRHAPSGNGGGQASPSSFTGDQAPAEEAGRGWS